MKSRSRPEISIKSTKLNYFQNGKSNILLVLLCANVSLTLSAVTFENDRNLITMPDDFNLNRLHSFPVNADSNAIYKKHQELINTEDDDDDDGDSSSDPIEDSGEIIESSDSNLESLESIDKLRRRLKGVRVTPSTTTSTEPTTTTTESDKVAVDLSNMKLSDYIKYFVHPNQGENLYKLQQLLLADRAKTEKTQEIHSTTTATATTEKEMEPPVKINKPKVTKHIFSNRLHQRKLGINIPVIRLKVDDRVPLVGKLDIKINAEDLKPFCWALVSFIILLLAAIILGCVFGVMYLRKMQTMQYQDFTNQNQNQLRELSARSCGNSTAGSSVRDRHRHASHLHPCRCGCEDDLTKTHIADIIRGDPDRDSGTSSHMGCSSIV